MCSMKLPTTGRPDLKIPNAGTLVFAFAFALLVAACGPSGAESARSEPPAGDTPMNLPQPQTQDTDRPIPPIDLAAPERVETATFALG